MKTHTLFSALIALTLTACNKPALTEGNSAQTSEVAPVAAKTDAKQTAHSGQFSKDFMTGKWADEKDGDCKLAQDFKADGSVDGAFDSWSVKGDELHAVMVGETLVFAVAMVDQKHIDVTSPQGKKSRLVRC